MREICSDSISELVFFYGLHFLHLYRVPLLAPCLCWAMLLLHDICYAQVLLGASLSLLNISTQLCCLCTMSVSNV